MTPADLSVIRSSFPVIAADPYGFLIDVRRRALLADPTLRDVLPPVTCADGIRIFAMLASVLDGIVSAEGARHAAHDLAQRHRMAKVRPGHYGVIGQALIEAVGARAGAAFTDNVRTAWADAYVLFAEALMARSYNTMELVA